MMLLAYVLVGLLAGALSGLLGIGGGVVLVPALSALFAWSGFPAARVMQSAVATSLAVMIFTTASAAYSHYRKGNLNRQLMLQFLPGMVVGIIWGSVIAHQLSSLDLELIFSILVCFVAYRLWFKRRSPLGPKPGWLSMGFSSSMIGMVAGLLGVGGGVLTVPYLLRYKISKAQAIALGAFFSFVAAVIGTFCWWFLSNPVPMAHELTTKNYINWQAALLAGCAGVLIAPWAVKWAKHLSEQALRRSLAILLFCLFLQKFISWLMVVVQ